MEYPITKWTQPRSATCWITLYTEHTYMILYNKVPCIHGGHWLGVLVLPRTACMVSLNDLIVKGHDEAKPTKHNYKDILLLFIIILLLQTKKVKKKQTTHDETYNKADTTWRTNHWLSHGDGIREALRDIKAIIVVRRAKAGAAFVWSITPKRELFDVFVLTKKYMSNPPQNVCVYAAYFQMHVIHAGWYLSEKSWLISWLSCSQELNRECCIIIQTVNPGHASIYVLLPDLKSPIYATIHGQVKK